MKTNWTCIPLQGTACILFTLCILLPSVAFASVDVLFSPRDNINYRIIEAINLSEVCIDVTTFDFTSKETADALVNAKRKGLKIRLLVDKKTLEDEESQVKRLKEIGFDVKVLKGKGKGDMRSAFLIFDGRLVIVGPYHLSEESGSYNYENAIFFDESGIVETYLNEFDRLFGSRSILKTTSRKSKDSLLSTIIRPSGNHLQDTEGVSISPEKLEKPVPADEIWNIETSTQTRPKDYDKEPQPYVEEYTEPSEAKSSSRDKKTASVERTPHHHPEINTPDKGQKALETQPLPPGSEDTTQMTLPMEPLTTSGGFIDISFEELDKIFGIDSPLSEKEKIALWSNYMGNYIKWTGEVRYTKIGLIKGTRIGFRHIRGSDVDTEVRFNIKSATKIMKIDEGDVISYTAKLIEWPTSHTPYYVLIEGVLE